jgi:hypothetical protein
MLPVGGMEVMETPLPAFGSMVRVLFGFPLSEFSACRNGPPCTGILYQSMEECQK